MTRVITFMMGARGQQPAAIATIGVSDGHHSVTHHQNDPEKIAKVAKIDAYLVQTFAYYPGEAESHARMATAPCSTTP